MPQTFSVPPLRHPPASFIFHPPPSPCPPPPPRTLSSSPGNRKPPPHLGPLAWVAGPGLSVWPSLPLPQPSRRRCWLPLLLGGRLLPCWVPGTGTRLTLPHISVHPCSDAPAPYPVPHHTTSVGGSYLRSPQPSAQGHLQRARAAPRLVSPLNPGLYTVNTLLSHPSTFPSCSNTSYFPLQGQLPSQVYCCPDPA